MRTQQKTIFPAAPRRRTLRRRGAGFTLAELTVSMGVLGLVMLGVGAMFQVHTRLGRQQMQVADMQQAARGAQNELVRMTRMAGRGGLGRGLAPNFLPIQVRNDVSAAGADSHIALGVGTSPEIRPGTDVLTVRGVINTPLYQVSEAAMVLDSTTNPTQGTVTINKLSPTGLEQDLGPLVEALNAATREPLILVSSFSDQVYAVVALAPGRSAVDDATSPTQIVAAFDVGSAGGPDLEDKYLALSAGGVFNSELNTVVFVGMVEEYRYYIREQLTDENDPSSPVVPRLARARFLAGTETAHPSNPTLATDVADGVVDLQIALGIDAGNDGRVDEVVGSPDRNDDWLFNDGGDAPIDADRWNNPGGRLPPLSHLRITTLTRTDRPDPLFNVRPINRIEDRVYTEMGPPGSEEEKRERLHRRRRMTTVVDLRNQG